MARRFGAGERAGGARWPAGRGTGGWCGQVRESACRRADARCGARQASGGPGGQVRTSDAATQHAKARATQVRHVAATSGGSPALGRIGGPRWASRQRHDWAGWQAGARGQCTARQQASTRASNTRYRGRQVRHAAATSGGGVPKHGFERRASTRGAAADGQRHKWAVRARARISGVSAGRCAVRRQTSERWAGRLAREQHMARGRQVRGPAARGTAAGGCAMRQRHAGRRDSTRVREQAGRGGRPAKAQVGSVRRQTSERWPAGARASSTWQEAGRCTSQQHMARGRQVRGPAARGTAADGCAMRQRHAGRRADMRVRAAVRHAVAGAGGVRLGGRIRGRGVVGTSVGAVWRAHPRARCGGLGSGMSVEMTDAC